VYFKDNLKFNLTDYILVNDLKNVKGNVNNRAEKAALGNIFNL